MSIYTFAPIYFERIWGGNQLSVLYGRTLPDGKPIGESWELVDREEAVSTLTEPAGELRNLNDLWTKKRLEIFGSRAPKTGRFPILLKLLDASEKLSLQVHPPSSVAARLDGEPKTELWYFLEVLDKARVYAGLKKGVTPEAFAAAVGTPALETMLHELKPQPGDMMYLPAGRVHSISGGNVIFEVQQNSDTTYRVDDWGRVDASGQRRQLHVKQSLASINFKDFEPQFVQSHGERAVNCPFFSVYRSFIFPGEYRTWHGDGTSFQYHFVAQGELKVETRAFKAGEGWLMSADHSDYELSPGPDGAELITVQFGSG
jgi:mannose-6-phosphate isomerase